MMIQAQKDITVEHRRKKIYRQGKHVSRHLNKINVTPEVDNQCYSAIFATSL